MMNSFLLNEHKCIAKSLGKPKICFLLPDFSAKMEDSVTSIFSLLKDETDFCLVVFEIKDWDNELTPWEANLNGRTFGLGGLETLKFLKEHLIPKLIEEYGKMEFCISGYSLAGLFALFTAAETKINYAVSCSGSLWYKDFEDYILQRDFSGKTVYLSLGEKEEHTKNSVLKTIGEKTRRLATYLSGNDCKCTLEMNPGGHFADSNERLYKGFSWIMDNMNP